MSRIDIPDITSVEKVQGTKSLLEVGFSRAKLGWFTRFALSGDPAAPRDRVILNLGDDRQRWQDQIRALSPLSAT